MTKGIWFQASGDEVTGNTDEGENSKPMTGGCLQSPTTALKSTKEGNGDNSVDETQANVAKDNGEGGDKSILEAKTAEEEGDRGNFPTDAAKEGETSIAEELFSAIMSDPNLPDKVSLLKLVYFFKPMCTNAKWAQ